MMMLFIFYQGCVPLDTHNACDYHLFLVFINNRDEMIPQALKHLVICVFYFYYAFGIRIEIITKQCHSKYSTYILLRYIIMASNCTSRNFSSQKEAFIYLNNKISEIQFNMCIYNLYISELFHFGFWKNDSNLTSSFVYIFVINSKQLYVMLYVNHW